MRLNLSAATLIVSACLLTVGTISPLAPSLSYAAAPETRTADQILKASADAITKVKALSYKARAFSEGPLAAGTPVHDATVTAIRAEAGGWKLALSGTAATTAKDVTESSKLELGYDGASAWSLKEKEKIAFTESIRKDSDVETFFKRNSAGPAVAWDILDAKPLSFGGKPALDGDAAVAGEDCTIVKITGAKTDGDPGNIVRIFVSKNDDLPRRIERLREIKDTDGSTKVVTRALELSSLKTDKDVVAVPFTLSAPDGYTIRTSPGSRRETTRPAGDPLKGPGVKDKDDGKGKSDGGMMQSDSKREAFPDFKLKDAEGKEFTLESYKGEIVVIDFWATWCGPCVAAMPDLQKIHTKYKDQKVKVVGVNVFEEKPADAVKFKKSKGYTYGLLLRGDDIAKQLKVNGIPCFFVLDANGKIIKRIGGYNKNLGTQLSELIDKELAATKK